MFRKTRGSFFLISALGAEYGRFGAALSPHFPTRVETQSGLRAKTNGSSRLRETSHHRHPRVAPHIWGWETGKEHDSG